MHLSHAYRKLDINSRRQLAAALARAPGPETDERATRPGIQGSGIDHRGCRAHRPGGQLTAALHGPQEGRLATAVATQDADRIAAIDVEVDVAQYPERRRLRPIADTTASFQ